MSGCARFAVGSATFAVGAALAPAAAAQTTRTLIDYFQPTPIVCTLTSNTWGAQALLPRDTCNGMEIPKTPPQYLYWDGKIIRARDGKYHPLESSARLSVPANSPRSEI